MVRWTSASDGVSRERRHPGSPASGGSGAPGRTPDGGAAGGVIGPRFWSHPRRPARRWRTYLVFLVFLVFLAVLAVLVVLRAAPVLRDVFRAAFGAGTLAPSSRASLSPMAMACLRLLTVRPDPLFSVPFFLRRIVDATFFAAAFPYFAITFLLDSLPSHPGQVSGLVRYAPWVAGCVNCKRRAGFRTASVRRAATCGQASS